MLFVNKSEIGVFDFGKAGLFTDFQVAFIEHFGVFCFFFAFFSIGDVIEVVAENVEERIDIIKSVIDVYNANKNENNHIDEISAHI